MEELTKSEERVMQVLWKLKSAFVKDIIEELGEEPKPPYNTISSTVRLLEKKGYVSYKAYGKTYEYFPSISKEAYTKTTFSKLFAGYFDNSPASLLSFMVREEQLISTCLMVFYGSYMLFLKNLSFFKANRVYLLATLSLSFIIPLLKFERSPDLAVVPFFNGYIPAEQITSKALAPISLNNEVNTLSLSGLVFCLYLLVAVLLLWRGLSKIHQITKFIYADFVRINGLKTGLTPENIQILLKHEEVHARQLHSLDKLIMVVCKALLWFNPIIYWYEMALEEVNEFEADAVTANVYSAGPYAGLLIELATKTQLNPVLHHFSRYSLKGRITMLCKTASTASLKWSYLTIVPLLICL
eukprot:gene19094-22722_t